jgi:2-C-methyl-D-erythritol 4-phosphate cytidylyltransferase/2-C-methyl-D-erythritol 2,4-cyclodiphosphate synthase
VDAFRSVADIAEVVLVCSEQLRSLVSSDSIHVVPGGASRQESVRNGVLKAEELGADHVLVHDAARALIDRAIIQAVIMSTREHGAAIAAVPVIDTIKQVNDSTVVRTVPRHDLWRAQTPQGARVVDLLRAYQIAEGKSFTDEAELLESIGIRAQIVEGSEENFKVTYPADLERARDILARRVRSG